MKTILKNIKKLVPISIYLSLISLTMQLTSHLRLMINLNHVDSLDHTVKWLFLYLVAVLVGIFIGFANWLKVPKLVLLYLCFTGYVLIDFYSNYYPERSEITGAMLVKVQSGKEGGRMITGIDEFDDYRFCFKSLAKKLSEEKPAKYTSFACEGKLNFDNLEQLENYEKLSFKDFLLAIVEGDSLLLISSNTH